MAILPLKNDKFNALLESLRGMQSALLAYSGGVDSTLLLKALELSGIRALAVTGVSPTTPPRDLEDAKRMAGLTGVEHRFVGTDEMEDENFTQNPPDRCFYCKDELFGKLRAIADKEGFAFVLDGTNLDDREDHRPGSRAARAHGVRSPLMEAGLTKRDIRDVSKALGLPTWDKLASPCLSSRFPYGLEITPAALKRVAGAEEYLRSLGFRQLRVRDHGELAVLELPPAEQEKAFKMRSEIVERLRALGYAFVSLDLEGLRSGSMNRLLKKGPPPEGASLKPLFLGGKRP